MITIKKLNKFYNRGKKNEIHVINDTSLELPDNGLIALLGPSGCGKTTLLNTIGGLDKPNSGEIIINGKRLTRIRTSKKDQIRTLNIGYIFQDYHLIEDLTVFDNIAIVLKMIGIKDKEEIKKRVNYVLERTGMYKYRKRLVTMLSGGERQRVGIARAIVKNPEIIIADEPTGNLDSKNTIEIMNIIKSISKEKLVILVTHEKDIAYFYSSRIINLLDGKVVEDIDNSHDKTLDYRIENKIYLKDMKNHEEIKSDNLKIDFYSDEKNKLNIKIVVKNGNVYIESEKDKVEVVDDDSTIELINDSYKKIDKETYEKYKFDFNNIINKDIKLKYSSIFNIFTLLKSGFAKLKSYSILKKILLGGFFVSSMFVLYSVCNIAGILEIKEEKFVTHNRNYVMVKMNTVDKDKYLEYKKLDNTIYMLPTTSDVSFKIKYNFYYQTYDATDALAGSLSSINMIKEKDLIYGHMPENEYEIVVDKMSIDKMFQRANAKQAGIYTVDGLLNLTAEIDNMKSFKIVGITDLKSPSIYVNDKLFINILSNTTVYNEYYDYGYYDVSIPDFSTDEKLLDYSLVDDLTIKKGKLPENDYEVIVNINNSYQYPLNKEIEIKVNNKKLKVVGYYEHKSINNFLVNENTVEYKLLDTNKDVIMYPKDKTKALNYFKENKINATDIYNNDKMAYLKDREESVKSTSLVAIIILVVSLVEIYLMIRSSFLSRIKEVGILRAIGLKKKDVYKMFLGEILAITLTASTLGLVIMGYIVKGLTELPLIKENYIFSWYTVLISILIVYVFNIVIGLLPVFRTMRKTPAQILSRIDAD